MSGAVKLEHLRCLGIVEEYDGDGLVSGQDTQLGDAHQTLRDIAEAIRAGFGPECAWPLDMVDEHCQCAYHTLKREMADVVE